MVDGPTVLLVDDDPALLRVTARLLARRGFDVVTCSHPFEVGGLVRARHPAAVVLDVNMPALGGGALSRFLQQQIGTHLPIVFYSGIDPIELSALAKERNGATYVCKSEGVDALEEQLHAVLGPLKR